MTKKIKILIFLIIFLIIAGTVFYLYLNKKDSVQVLEEQLFDIDPPSHFEEYQIQKFNEQLDILKQLYNQDQVDADFWIGLGNLYQITENYPKAIQFYVNAGQIAPLNTVSFANLARLYEKKIKDYIQAESYYQQAIKNNPEDVWLFIDLSKLYRNKLNDLKKEEEILLKGSQENPDNPEILLFLCNFYERNNDVEKAIQYIEKAIEIFPQNILYQEKLEELKEK